MKRKRCTSWERLAWDGWALGMEASTVVGLRALRLSGGGRPARRERRRMVVEKIDAALALQGALLTGSLGVTPRSAASKALKHYRRKVRANRRRLLKP
jgi:hypothetical protein